MSGGEFELEPLSAEIRGRCLAVWVDALRLPIHTAKMSGATTPAPHRMSMGRARAC